MCKMNCVAVLMMIRKKKEAKVDAVIKLPSEF